MGRPGRAGIRLCSKWLGSLKLPLRCAVLKLNQEVSRVMHVHLPLWRGMCVHQLHYLPVDETLGGFLFARCGHPTEVGSVAVTAASTERR